MDLNEALNSFAVRLYEWAVIDFTRELHDNCPLLSSIANNNRNIAAFVSWSKDLSLHERGQLARAMTLMFHNNARNLLEEPITPEIEFWGEQFYEQTTLRLHALPPLAIANPEETATAFPSVGWVIEAIGRNLTSAFGQVQRSQDRVSSCRYFLDWRIFTDFVYAEKEGNLAFEYQFVREDGSRVLEEGYGPFPRNLFAFYGIWTHTVVRIPSRVDCEPVAKATVKLAEHFIAQAGPLFAGLGIND